MTLAEASIDYRARHRLSQEDLARLTGFTRQTITNVEAGKRMRKTTEALLWRIFREEDEHEV